MKSSSVKNRWLSGSLVCALTLMGGVATLVTPQRANAQWSVACVNCSDIITQIMGYVEQLLQYSTQIQQYQKQLDEYANMLKNTKNLGRSSFDNALSLVRGIEYRLQSGTNISYALSNLESQFRAKNPDYQSVFNSIRYMTESQSINAQAQRSQETMDAALTTLQAASLQSQGMSSDQGRLDSINGMLMGADGNLDAMQAAAQYAQHSAQQILKLRQIGLIQIQQQSQFMADQQRKEDLARAASQRWVEDKPATPRATPNTVNGQVL